MQKVRSMADNGLDKVRKVPRKVGEKVGKAYDTTRSLIYKIIVAVLTLVLLVVVSVFMYGSFYFAFVPAPEHEGPVFLAFDTCKQQQRELSERCGFLNGSVQLSKRSPFLMTGPPYTISVSLDVPESPANQDLGMFMNCVQLKSAPNLNVVASSCRTGLLPYRSPLLRLADTLTFLPVFLIGRRVERLTVDIDFFEDFHDNPLDPAVVLDLQVMSTRVEIYAARYRIRAGFGGVRYLMYHYPLMSALVGVACNMAFLAVVILVSWWQFFGKFDEGEREDDDDEVSNDDNDDQLKKVDEADSDKEEAEEDSEEKVYESEKEGKWKDDSESDASEFVMGRAVEELEGGQNHEEDRPVDLTTDKTAAD